MGKFQKISLSIVLILVYLTVLLYLAYTRTMIFMCICRHEQYKKQHLPRLVKNGSGETLN